MSNPYRDRLLTVGYLSRGRTRPRIREGHDHPQSGKPFKAVTDEAGNTVTEHGDPGTGVSARQDVNIRASHVETVVPGE